MPQRNDRSRSTPTTSPKNNSWFRMQAGHQSDADIYIYDEIGFWGVTAKQFISDLNALGDITHINLHINSPGGDVFEGIAIFNALKTHGASITVYVDGVAASMASVIAMVGNPVIMPENTFMMIHKPFGFTGGDAEDMKALIVRMVSGSSDAAVADFSLLPEENGIPERTDEELMHLGEGISGGVRYGPDSQPGH